jgi:hypothetical protein
MACIYFLLAISEGFELKPVIDAFVQCERCNQWDRLSPEDNEGLRTVPLLRNPYVGWLWLCDHCWQDAEDNGWEV